MRFGCTRVQYEGISIILLETRFITCHVTVDTCLWVGCCVSHSKCGVSVVSTLLMGGTWLWMAFTVEVVVAHIGRVSTTVVVRWIEPAVLLQVACLSTVKAGSVLVLVDWWMS